MPHSTCAVKHYFPISIIPFTILYFALLAQYIVGLLQYAVKTVEQMAEMLLFQYRTPLSSLGVIHKNRLVNFFKLNVIQCSVQQCNK